MEFDIYKRLKGANGPFFIVEISSNHNGEMSKAKKMIDMVIKAGADCVKFQSWSKNSLSSKKVYEGREKLAAENQRICMTKEKFKEIKEYCDQKKILLSSSAFSNEEIDMLVNLNMPFLKISSLDLTNIPLIKYAAKTNLPIVMSVGMSNLEDIEKAIETIKNEGNQKAILTHCVSLYPTHDGIVNLRAINILKETFNLPVGFSDHTIGHAAPIAAATLGACIIEKHVLLNDGKSCREQSFALPIVQLASLIDNIKRIPYMMQKKGLVLSDEEIEERHRMRRSIVTNKPLIEGNIIKKEDIDFKRPGTGISPGELKYILGRKLKVNKTQDELIFWNDLH